MKRRKLGATLEVGAIGLGCMGMTGFYGPTDDAESTRTLRAAVDRGVTLFDTADRYGLGRNEEIVGRALAGLDVVIATKFGIVPGPTPGTRALDGSPEYVRRACEASLRRLGRERIDLYYVHRVGKTTPIEETIGALAELVQAGKVGHIGLSEVGPATLRRAAAVHPIAAVQSELSLWRRDRELDVLPACAELGVGFVAYAPLGLGMLTATLRTAEDLAPGDYRPGTPRFAPGHFEQNRALVDAAAQLAAAKGCTPAQLALAWLLAKGDHIVPIPGTKRTERLAENLEAANLVLTTAELERLDRLFPLGAAVGDPHPPEGMAWLNG